MKSLKNAGLIRGVFRELAILGIPVSATDGESTESVFISLVSDHAAKNGENPLIKVIGSRQFLAQLDLKFHVDDDLYSTQLVQNSSGENLYEFPAEMSISNQRTKSRTTATEFGKSEMIGELRGLGWRRFGTVKDFSQTWLSIQIDPPGVPIAPMDHVAVRVYSDSQEVFIAKCLVRAVRLAGSSVLIVLNLSSNRSEEKLIIDSRGHDREAPRNASIQAIQWPDTDGITVSFSVVDCGIGGFRGRIIGNPADVPPVGAVVAIVGSPAKMRIAWHMGSELGFDARINDRVRFNDWLNISAKWKDETMSAQAPKTATRRIVSSLLRSGYLSGEKASNFAEHQSKEALVPQDATTSRWIRRFAKSTGKKFSEHVSFLRLSDSSWLIQELGNASEQRGIADRLIVDGLVDLTLKEEAFLSATSVLVALYSSSIAFNERFWSSRAKELGLAEHTTYVGAIKPTWFSDLSPKNFEGIQCADLTPFDWRKTFKLLESHFPHDALASIGITGDGYHSPQLSRDLFDSGHILKRRTTLIMNGNDILAVAVIFGLPTYANLTVSANHVWVIAKSFPDVVNAVGAIRFSSTHSDLLLGVTQIVAITTEASFERPENDPWASRHFKTLALPFSRILEFCRNGKK